MKKKPMPVKAGAGKETRKEEMAEANAIKSGAMSPAQYANMESAEGYRDGGIVWDCTQGTGVRSMQDYKK